jgi:hypothetical protein
MKVGDLVRVTSPANRDKGRAFRAGRAFFDGQLGVLIDYIPRSSTDCWGEWAVMLMSGKNFYFYPDELELADESR